MSNRNASARVVISSVDTHAAAIASSLTAIDARLPPSVRLGPDGIRAMLGWLGATLRQQDRALEQAELSYVAEQADDAPWRARRDDAIATLQGRLAVARERISTVLGADQVAVYGLAGVTPRVAAPLLDRATVVVRLLREHPRDVPDGLGGRVDTEALAAALEEAATPLREAMAAVTAEQRQLEAAMLTRDAVASEWTDTYQGVADALTGLYRLAGRRDLAERIRPTVRRAIGDEAPPDAGDVAPGGGVAGDVTGGADGDGAVDTAADVAAAEVAAAAS